MGLLRSVERINQSRANNALIGMGRRSAAAEVHLADVRLADLSWVAERLGVSRGELLEKYVGWGLAHDRAELARRAAEG